VEGPEEAVRSLQEMQQVFVPALLLWYYFFVHVIRFEKSFAFPENYNPLSENSQFAFKKAYSILKNEQNVQLSNFWRKLKMLVFLLIAKFWKKVKENLAMDEIQGLKRNVAYLG
jgi:hypothetical protein